MAGVQGVRLVTVGDDSGMCHSANVAMCECFDGGIMRNTNLIVPCAAFEEAANSMEGSRFSEYARNVVQLSRVSRDDITDLVCRPDLIGVRSPILEAAMNSVANSSRKDPQAAGKVALNLAQSINGLRKGEARIEERLRGVIDMMRSTSTIFAPLVLGITSSLFAVSSDETRSSVFISEKKSPPVQLLTSASMSLCFLGKPDSR